MRFSETPISGAFLVELDLLIDERGWFARSWCRQSFADRGLNASLDQCSVSFNERAGTLRGMHYQADPHSETKLVRCTRGAIYDVIVDLRPDSPSFRRWHSVTLSDENHLALYIPTNVAHGFQTLVDRCEILYQISEPYKPSHARGLRWNDPAFAITWPDAATRIISDKDRSYPDFHP